MKVIKIEERFKEGQPTLLLLDLNEWIPTVRQQLTFCRKGFLYQFSPCPSRQCQTEWQRIEKNSQHSLSICHLRPPIGHEPREDVPVSMKHAQHSQMDC